MVSNEEYWDMTLTIHNLHTLKTERIICIDGFQFLLVDY